MKLSLAVLLLADARYDAGRPPGPLAVAGLAAAHDLSLRRWPPARPGRTVAPRLINSWLEPAA